MRGSGWLAGFHLAPIVGPDRFSSAHARRHGRACCSVRRHGRHLFGDIADRSCWRALAGEEACLRLAARAWMMASAQTPTLPALAILGPGSASPPSGTTKL